MQWLLDLYRTHPTAQAIAVVSSACLIGMGFGSIKVKGVGLGTAGVLFAGILIGSLSEPLDHATLEFIKEFGLILFVFCIGLQLGPGFVSSLRQFGLRLNLLAGAVVISGALLASGLGWVLQMDFAAVLGLFSGATTNTPSLGAGQQTLAAMSGVSPERLALPALAYAVSYPTAIVGIIATMLILKKALGIDPLHEAQSLVAEQQRASDPIHRRTLVIDNSNLDGLAIASLPGLRETDVAVSRFRRAGEPQVQVALGSTVIRVGDRILTVGTDRNLDQFQRVVGHASDENLMEATGSVTDRQVSVTNKIALGKTVEQLRLDQLFGVAVTRVTRGSVEMTAVPSVHLQFGDVLRVVGTEEGTEHAAALLGNSLKKLNETHFVPLFAGIVAGIVLGTLPIAVPGLPQPLRLGLAGGPLIIAIVVGRIGRIGPLVWHMPLNANLAFRELGIALFFACAGLLAGPQFFSSVFSSQGLLWLASGACVTVLPLLAVGYLALAVWKLNYAVVAGLIAGSMTDPPALAFATNICGSEAPNVAYAAVYPFTTVMRILAAQVMAVTLCG